MDDKFDDYFNEQTGVTDREPKTEPKTPSASEREDKQLEEATIDRSHNRIRTVIISVIVLAVLSLSVWVWQLYWHPYSHEQRKGFITAVKLQGNVFKTFEGTMLEVSYIGNGYHIDDTVNFSIDGDSIAIAAQMLQGNGRRVVLDLDEYKHTLPWRGNTRLLATAIKVDSTMDVRNIVPTQETAKQE